MAVEEDWNGNLHRTDAYAALDPTEKGMVSYFLGMVLCKLFATRLLQTPWLLHLDVFRAQLNPAILGRSRPDLVGEDFSGRWHAFESKGRSSAPSFADKTKAKTQAQRLVAVGGTNCSLHVGSFAFFHNDILEFYWSDPEPDSKKSVAIPEPREEWRYYFEPALKLASEFEVASFVAEREMANVEVKIHRKIDVLLQSGNWLRARKAANDLRGVFETEGYQPDGIKVLAGDSWAKRFEPRERG
jgi:hypothetical protein